MSDRLEEIRALPCPKGWGCNGEASCISTKELEGAIEWLIAEVERLRAYLKANDEQLSRSGLVLGGLTQERDDARANVERFRSSNYALEELVHTRAAERDEARADAAELRVENRLLQDRLDTALGKR